MHVLHGLQPTLDHTTPLSGPSPHYDADPCPHLSTPPFTRQPSHSVTSSCCVSLTVTSVTPAAGGRLLNRHISSLVCEQESRTLGPSHVRGDGELAREPC